MSVFSKSVVNTLVASIFVINAPLYAGEVEYVAEEDNVQETKKEVERRIEIKAKNGKPVRIFVDSEGQEHIFELTEKELKNLDEVNSKLEHLDKETLAKVKQALANVTKNLENLKAGDHLRHVEELSELGSTKMKVKMLKLDKLSELSELESLENLKELGVLEALMDKEHAVVIRERIREERHSHDDEEHEEKRVFVIDGGEGNVVFHSGDDANITRFKLGEGNTMLKGHLDAILKLIEHGEFTADELNKLQIMLDSKR